MPMSFFSGNDIPGLFHIGSVAGVFVTRHRTTSDIGARNVPNLD